MPDSARSRGTSKQNGFYNPQQRDDRTEERQALLDEALAGSDQAHVALVDSYRKELIRYFAEHLSEALRQKIDPEDLAQRATLRAWQKFAGFIGRELKTYRASARSPSAPGGWGPKKCNIKIPACGCGGGDRSAGDELGFDVVREDDGFGLARGFG